MSRRIEQHQIAENVFAFAGPEFNWVIVQEGTELTLVDTGWHGDIKEVDPPSGRWADGRRTYGSSS